MSSDSYRRKAEKMSAVAASHYRVVKLLSNALRAVMDHQPVHLGCTVCENAVAALALASRSGRDL